MLHVYWCRGFDEFNKIKGSEDEESFFDSISCLETGNAFTSTQQRLLHGVGHSPELINATHKSKLSSGFMTKTLHC